MAMVCTELRMPRDVGVVVAVVVHARQRDAAVGGDREGRIVRDFPDMAVRIGEIAVPAAPEGAARRLDDAAAGLLGRSQHFVDLGVRAGVVGKVDAAKASAGVNSMPGILRQLGARKQAEDRSPPIWKKATPSVIAGVAGQAHRLVEGTARSRSSTPIVMIEMRGSIAIPPSIRVCACR